MDKENITSFGRLIGTGIKKAFYEESLAIFLRSSVVLVVTKSDPESRQIF